MFGKGGAEFGRSGVWGVRCLEVWVVWGGGCLKRVGGVLGVGLKVRVVGGSGGGVFGGQENGFGGCGIWGVRGLGG